MIIVQISDLHIAPAGHRTLGVAPMAENLARCVEHINRITPRVDLVMVTGDITQDATRAEAENAARLLDRLRAPYHVIPGNHDDRDVLWSVFAARGRTGQNHTDPNHTGPNHTGPDHTDQNRGFMNFVIEGGAVRLIAMDSVMAGSPGGEICRTRAAWLGARLAEAPGRQTAIFMHHPPVNLGVGETDLDGFRGAETLGDIIGRHAKNIAGIFCGHIHLPAQTLWRGTLVSTCPCMGMRLAPDLTLKEPSRFVLDDPGYQLHLVGDDGRIVTHTFHARRSDQPHDF